MTSEDLATFVSIDAVKLPDAPAYLATDVELGADSRNVRPDEALDHDLARDGFLCPTGRGCLGTRRITPWRDGHPRL